MEKAVAHPLACKDSQGRLRVAAATTSAGGHERTERLIDAGVDLVVSIPRTAIPHGCWKPSTASSGFPMRCR